MRFYRKAHSMEKHLHTTNQPSKKPISITPSIIEQVMEEEFAAEIAAVKNVQLAPRPEAVAALMALIGQSSVAEQH